jgi:hypothetical protein
MEATLKTCISIVESYNFVRSDEDYSNKTKKEIKTDELKNKVFERLLSRFIKKTPKSVFLPSKEVFRIILKALAFYGNKNKDSEVLKMFGF